MPLNQLSLPLVLFVGFLLLDANVAIVSDQVQIILEPRFQLSKSHVGLDVLWVKLLRMAT